MVVSPLEIKSTDTISRQEAQNDPNGIFMDKDEEPAEIVDVDAVTASIIEFLEYVKTPSMLQLEASSDLEFKQHLDRKFEDFSNKFPSIFNMLTDSKNRSENVNKLIELLGKLKMIKNGNLNMDNEFDKYKEKLSEEYIYPKFGGKKKFEQKMMKGKQKKVKSAKK